MENLIAFLTKSFHWILFLLLELISVVLLFKYNGYQGSVWISSSNAIAGKVYEWQSGVEQYFSLKTINQQLVERNVMLEQQLYRLRNQLYTLTDTVAVNHAEYDSLSNFMLMSAKVVRVTTQEPNNLVTIDKGSTDGVCVDMGVVSGKGVVGVVYLVNDHYSVVLPVLNPRSRISCAIRGKDYFGILSWSGGDPRYAYVEGIPRHAKFERGEWIETNGYSAIFPPGVTVGRIVDIQNSRDGQSYRLKVELSTDFTCLRDVCIITDKTFLERQLLERAAADSLEKKNQN